MFNDQEPNTPSADSRPLSISELTLRIKRLLETQIGDILAEGEISGFKPAASGHLYLDLKDSGALIKCVVWAADAARIRFRPKEGDKVEVRGRLTVYDQRGQYQLRITAMRPAGLGKLYQAFLEMKERLAEEGLFDPERKKPIPAHPRLIGLVTSPTGAAIQDMLNILSRRAPHIPVLVWPAKVQGEGAANEVASAIRGFNSMPDRPDVLIVGRGGGSLEDLWAFNEEVVARAIADSSIPIISAVGHETDTTIADFVSDLRAPTPSAAAELVVRDSSDLLKSVSVLQSRAYRALRQQMNFLLQAPHLSTRLENSFLPRLQSYAALLKEFQRSYGIQLPLQRINLGKQIQDDFQERIERAINQKIDSRRHSWDKCSGRLSALNPKAILKRGYSITYNRNTEQVISSSKMVSSGTPLRIILGSGQLDAVVGDSTIRAAKPRQTRKSKSNIVEWFGSESNE